MYLKTANVKKWHIYCHLKAKEMMISLEDFLQKSKKETWGNPYYSNQTKKLF